MTANSWAARVEANRRTFTKVCEILGDLKPDHTPAGDPTAMLISPAFSLHYLAEAENRVGTDHPKVIEAARLLYDQAHPDAEYRRDLATHFGFD